MNTDFLIEKSVQIRQIRVIRVPNHGNSQRAEFFQHGKLLEREWMCVFYF